MQSDRTAPVLSRQHPLELTFLDDVSAKAVDWNSLWAQFRPLTPYGIRKKALLRPFLPGEEAACARAWAQLRHDAANWTDGQAAAAQALIGKLPDIADALIALATPASALAPRQLLVMKQFLVLGVSSASDHWTHSGRWQRALAAFGDSSAPTFAVDHVAGPDYAVALREQARAAAVMAAAVRQRDALWAQSVGQRPHRDSTLTLRLPDASDLAQRLKRDGRLQWLRDTPYDSVFEVLDTPAMTAAKLELAAIQASVDVLADAAIRRLCDELRAILPQLRQLADAVADWDLRLAKVRLLHRWQGAVADFGDRWMVAGAVHPLVAERIGWEQYVPLHISLSAGVSVLCGSNMGGKTVALSLAAVCQVLAQYGLPIPARRFTTRLFRLVRFATGADSDMTDGLSSFGREITRLAAVWDDWRACAALDGAQPALLLFDEPARSTNPLEGEALVIGLLRAAARRADSAPASVTFCSTHFPGAIELEGVVKFRVSGLQTGALPACQGDSSGGSADDSALGSDDSGGSGDGSALGGDGSGGPDTAAGRVELLAAAMDYRITPLCATDMPTEALTVAAWLGLQAEILGESRSFLTSRKGRRI